MNFQKIPPVPETAAILDQAFRKAREKGKSKNLTGNWLQIIRKKEAMKLDIIKDNLNVKLDIILTTFPGLANLPPFYIKLMDYTLDYPKFKKSLGAVNWAKEKINFFHRSYISKIIKEKHRDKIKIFSKQFYGRISSVMRQVHRNIKFLEDCRKIMRSYPDIKEMFSVCVYGFPNVGKSTLLNKLTGTKAKTAAYSFTTTSINVGYIEIGDKKIQILDVPGTLARAEKMNNVERQADLVLNEIADIVIYVFDLSEQIAFSLQKQKKLYQNIKDKKKVLIFLSKQDIIEEDVINSFKYKHYSFEDLKAKIKFLAK